MTCYHRITVQEALTKHMDDYASAIIQRAQVANIDLNAPCAVFTEAGVEDFDLALTSELPSGYVCLETDEEVMLLQNNRLVFAYAYAHASDHQSRGEVIFPNEKPTLMGVFNYALEHYKWVKVDE